MPSFPRPRSTPPLPPQPLVPYEVERARRIAEINADPRCAAALGAAAQLRAAPAAAEAPGGGDQRAEAGRPEAAGAASTAEAAGAAGVAGAAGAAGVGETAEAAGLAGAAGLAEAAEAAEPVQPEGVLDLARAA